MALYSGSIQVSWIDPKAPDDFVWHVEDRVVRARGMNEAVNKLVDLGMHLPEVEALRDRWLELKARLDIEHVRKVTK
jgi:hypothetical protein